MIAAMGVLHDRLRKPVAERSAMRRCQIWLLLFAVLLFFGLLENQLVCAGGMMEHEHTYYISDGSFESNGILFYYLNELVSGENYVTNSTLFERRLISVVSGFATLIGVFFLGKLVSNNWRSGLYCTFVLGVNFMFLASSAHGRFFALNNLAVVLSFLLLVLWSRYRFWWLWVLYAVSLLLMVGTMAISTSLLAVHAVYVARVVGIRSRTALGFVCVSLLAGAFFLWLCQRDSEALDRFNYSLAALNGVAHMHLLNGACYYSSPTWMVAMRLASPLRYGVEVSWNSVCTRMPGVHLMIACSMWWWALVFWLMVSRDAGDGKGCQMQMSREYRALGWGCLLVLALLIVFNVTVKCVLTPTNCIMLLPLEAVLLGCALERFRLARVLVALGLLLLPYQMNWLTFINSDGLDRSMANFWPRRNTRILCIDWRAFSRNIPHVYVDEEGVDPSQKACFGKMSGLDCVTFTVHLRLASGYLRQMSTLPSRCGDSVWVFCGPIPEDDYWEALISYYEHSPQFAVLKCRNMEAWYIRFLR